MALAEEHSRRAIDLDAPVAQARVTLGTVHAGSGRPQEAVRDLRRALDRDPRNADAYREMANACTRLGKLAEADNAWRKSLALHPTAAAAANVGTRQFYLGHYAEAASSFEKAVAIDDRDGRVWKNLALVERIRLIGEALVPAAPPQTRPRKR